MAKKITNIPKIRVRNVMQGIKRSDGSSTNLLMGGVWWDALDKIAEETHLRPDDVVAAFISVTPKPGMLSTTVRMGIFRYFADASKGVTRRRGDQYLAGLAQKEIAFKEGSIKQTKNGRTIKFAMPSEHWQALENMQIPRTKSGVFVVGKRLFSNSTFAWPSRQLAQAALRHYRGIVSNHG